MLFRMFKSNGPRKHKISKKCDNMHYFKILFMLEVNYTLMLFIIL